MSSISILMMTLCRTYLAPLIQVYSLIKGQAGVTITSHSCVFIFGPSCFKQGSLFIYPNFRESCILGFILGIHVSGDFFGHFKIVVYLCILDAERQMSA